jgi:hypothetical protein
MSAADPLSSRFQGPAPAPPGRDSEAGETAQAPVITPTPGQKDYNSLKNTNRVAELLARFGSDPKPGSRLGTLLPNWWPTSPAWDGAWSLPAGSVHTQAGLSEGSTRTDETTTGAEPALTEASDNTPEVGDSASATAAMEPRPDAALDGADGGSDTGADPMTDFNLAMIEARVTGHLDAQDCADVLVDRFVLQDVWSW